MLAGLAILGVYWLFRIIEVRKIRKELPMSLSAAFKKRSIAFDGVRACGKFIFKWRRVPLVLIGMSCGGLVELGLHEEQVAWKESEPLPMSLSETIAYFVFGGFVFGIPPAIIVTFTGEFFFWLLKRFDKHLEPV